MISYVSPVHYVCTTRFECCTKIRVLKWFFVVSDVRLVKGVQLMPLRYYLPTRRVLCSNEHLFVVSIDQFCVKM